MKRLLMLGMILAAPIFVASTLASMPRAQAATECQAEIVKGRTSHWTYRLIDGRKCWYEGKTQLPKSELYWADSKPPEAKIAPEARESPPAPANQRVTNGQAGPQQVEAEESHDPEDGSCCWPPQKGDSFEARWQSLGLRPGK
jgi:uncharacterized protein YfaP (DUF2135 family)